MITDSHIGRTYPATDPYVVSAAKVAEFAAAGGDSNYVWSLSNETLGTLYAANETALYQSTTNVGTNILTVLDGSNNFASAKIYQR